MFFRKKKKPVREGLPRGAADAAVSCYKKGFSCSQAILSVYGEQFGLDREIALRVAGAFGGGMGSMGETCGCVTGAFMVIGLKHSKTKGSEEAEREKGDLLVQEFVDRFRARHGSIVCRELLGCDLGTPEGLKKAKKEKHFGKRCPEFVKDAAGILDELLTDYRE
jgi:C_GCAxxG_C_C family probable redox protein